MAALHRDARRAPGPMRRRSASGSSRPSPTSSMRPAACCWSATAAAALAVAAAGTGRRAARPPTQLRGRRRFLGASSKRAAGSSSSKRLRSGWASARDKATAGAALAARRRAQAWAGVPLIHDERLVGLVLLAAPDYRRPLDWEDFDLLRTAGRQAASSLAEAHRPGGAGRTPSGSRSSTAASPSSCTTSRIWSASCRCSPAMPSGTPTIPSSAPTWSRRCKRSVGKMNDLLARLAPQSQARVQRVERAAAAADPDRRDRRQAPRPRGQAARRRRACGRMVDAARSSRRSAISSRMRSTPARRPSR